VIEELICQCFSRGTFITFNGPPLIPFIKIKQIHSNKILSAQLIKNDQLVGDGLYLEKGIKKNLCILTADCLPVLFIGDEGEALIHAGWRGIKDGILENKILKKLKPKQVFIGPSIKKCCYEVSPDFHLNFPSSECFIKKGDKLFFSLDQEITDQLKKLFPFLEILVDKHCTCCDKKFHSFRRDKTEKRNYNVWIPSIEI
jgi:polyphenol oxidase